MDPKPLTILPFSPEDRLESWKEIAFHLRKNTRTVQRWESEGLPVYRHQHSKYGSIYAYKSEVEAWCVARRPSVKHTPRRERSFLNPVSFAHNPRLLIFAAGLVLTVFSGIALEQMLSRYRTAEASKLAGIKPVTIAVVSLQDVSAGSQDRALTQALIADITKELRRSHFVRIVESAAMPSVRTGASVRAQTIEELQASLARQGNHIRITAQLVDVATQKAIWSTQFDSDAGADEAFQKRISIAIASGVENALALTRQ